MTQANEPTPIDTNIDPNHPQAKTDGEKPLQDRSLQIGSEHVNVNTVTNKVLEDIDFLRDRIRMLENQATPNTVILNTYQKMLESRESVLGWLEEHEVICSVKRDNQASEEPKKVG